MNQASIDQQLPLVELPRRYIATPASTTFLEAAAHNPRFRPHSAFIPVSAEGDAEAAGLYELDLRSDTLTKVCSLPAEGLYFGCKVSDRGMCFICVGNQGRVLALDLAHPSPTAAPFVELPGSFEPNDLALDAANERLFIAANDQIYSPLTVRGQTLNALRITAQKGGTVFCASTRAPGPVTPFVSGLRILAGSVCVPEDGPGGALWLSELNNLIRVPLDAPADWRRVAPFDPRLLADNLDVHGQELLFPYYRVVDGLSARLMRSPWISRFAYALARCFPARCFGESPPPGEAADTLEDVIWGRYDIARERLVEHRILTGDATFDGHCTALERVGTQLVFINYLKKKILVVDASTLSTEAS